MSEIKPKIKIAEVASQGLIVLRGVPQVKIAEKGAYTGLPVVEVTCAFEGYAYDTQRVFEIIKETGIRTVVIAGEEPLTQERAVAELLSMFEVAQLKCQVEHEGVVSMRDFVGFRSATHFVEFLCPSSKKSARNQVSMISAMRPSDQLSFVIGSEDDYTYMKRVIQANRSQSPITLRAANDKVDLDKWVLEDREIGTLFPRDPFKFKVLY